MEIKKKTEEIVDNIKKTVDIWQSNEVTSFALHLSRRQGELIYTRSIENMLVKWSFRYRSTNYQTLLAMAYHNNRQISPKTE